MIRHAFKMIWNRRRANALVLVELLVSFLVLAAVLTVGCYYLDNWRRPLGFQYRNVWDLDVEHQSYFQSDEEQKAAIRETTEQVHTMLLAQPEIEALSPLSINLPFSRSSWGNNTYLHGVQRRVQTCEVTPAAIDVLEFRLLAGRWLEPGDESLNWIPTVISRGLAREMYGGEDPLGQVFAFFDKEGEPEDLGEREREYRVVGVVADYRRYGEFAAPEYTMFTPPQGDWPTQNFVLRIGAGVTAAFEEKLLGAAGDIAPDWTFRITPLEKAHGESVRQALLPLMIGTTVAGFLIAMVGMGLVGVVWQNVTRRTRELGLRRAVGATAADVRRQILLEILALTTFAVAAGSLIYIQAPLLGAFGHVPGHVYAIALALSLAIIYLFSAICGAYPSWLATRVNPVEALQYE